ncbi:MAG: hypothetical protein HOI53_01255 [Francisellaceae bacterium]|jgi:hypothetical protein|nr:hypothetical protein [Francisellaceae bacterium]MBT6206629.1 hypothetical protein [Francisellaceae bacterium]MBT6539521.1 hypothetical protein [Francisellaceae bacterium]
MSQQEPLPDHILECIENLRNQVNEEILEQASLEVALESAVKHLPVYLKVVKSHIEQLSRVLNTEQHNHKTLETADLAQPVRQLMSIFKELSDDDLLTMEQLASLSKIQGTVVRTTQEDHVQSQTAPS